MGSAKKKEKNCTDMTCERSSLFKEITDQDSQKTPKTDDMGAFLGPCPEGQELDVPEDRRHAGEAPAHSRSDNAWWGKHLLKSPRGTVPGLNMAAYEQAEL